MRNLAGVGGFGVELVCEHLFLLISLDPFAKLSFREKSFAVAPCAKLCLRQSLLSVDPCARRWFGEYTLIIGGE